MTKAFKPSLLVKQNREVLFRVGILLKGFNGFLEILGGVALFSVGPQFLLKVVRYVTQDEIAEDPHDLVANFLRHIATHLSISGEHLFGLFLLIDGLINIGLVVALLKRIRIAYPIATAIYATVFIYEIYRFIIHPSLGLTALATIDLIVIALVLFEYHAISSHDT